MLKRTRRADRSRNDRIVVPPALLAERGIRIRERRWKLDAKKRIRHHHEMTDIECDRHRHLVAEGAGRGWIQAASVVSLK